MADNIDKDKPNDDIQQNSNNDNNENVIKEDSHNNLSNQIKDEDQSQDIKTSDLVVSAPIPESESEKRCTSASNAGESEYESADDEDVNTNVDNDAIDDNVTANECQHKENESVTQTNDKINDEIRVNNNELESNNSTENESRLEENQVINTANVDNTDVDKEVDQQKSFVGTNQSNEDNRQTVNEETVEQSSKEKAVESIEATEQIKENSKLDAVSSTNNEVIGDSKASDDVLIEELDENSKKEENFEMEPTNADEIDEDFIDEEGGHEGIAEVDDDDEYEDIDDSDECSVNSENEENDDLRQQKLTAKDSEDLEGERQQGDGEESNDSQQNAKDKALDHDEDKRNPQYIPKRGPFYEHDDRMSEMAAAEEAIVEVEPAANDEKPPKPIVIAKNPAGSVDSKKNTRKKLWNESERWGHDLFNEDEQVPKSKDELVNIYGYDIRNEDDPPKARRRRRYGRGPNKYTRQWQDENAYGKGKVSPINDHNRSVRNDNNDRNDRNERSERQYNVRDRADRKARSDRNNEFSHKKSNFRNDKPVSDKRLEFREENVGKRVQPFSTDDFPELPNNDLRKKLTSNASSQQQEVWKAPPRYSQHSISDENKHEKEFKTEPMKIIDAIENNNRSPNNYNEVNSSNVVRTQTFENSKYSQRRSSAGYDYEEEDRRGGRARSRPNNESSNGRAIRKTNNNLNYSSYSHGKEVSTDSYRNRNSGRSERGYHEEPNRDTERYYEEDSYRNQRDPSNYVSDTTAGLQKMSIEEKASSINRNNESEQTRPKRYSSLRQQQQRVIPENIPNTSNNSQLGQGGDTRNLNAHQYYDSHQMQTPAYFAETSAPRNTYHTYMSPNAAETPPQTHPSNYLPQQLPTRYMSQPTAPPTGEPTRYLPPSVTANVVTAPVPPAIPAIPQTGPPPPPAVMSAVAPPPPPGTTYIPSFPSGYPQYPPPPQPTHVPPGYPGHVAQAQPPTPHQMAELYRGGVTYYDTQSQQQHNVRQIPQRRPKAAIPIVPPPDQHSSDGDGDKSYVSVNS